MKCKGGYATLDETPGSAQFFDQEGFLYNIGKCICSDDLKPLLDPIIDAIAEAMEKIGEILSKICISMLETVKQVVDVGIMAIPGGSAVKAVSWGVRAAKTLVENGKTAEDMFPNWIGKVCSDASYKGFDIMTAFQQFSEAPDSMGTSAGCFNKKGCKRSPPRHDPPKAPKKPESPPEKPKTPPEKPKNPPEKPTTHGPDKTPTTTADKPTATTTSTKKDSDACKINKRAVAGLYEKKKLGDAESSLDCIPNPPTMHLTETKQPIGDYKVRVPQKCPREFAQACYHYSSVMQIHAATRSMTEFTCGETKSNYRDNHDLKATALDRWGATAIATRAGRNQHWWPWAQGWVLRKNKESNQGECERDEWPPAYFWPGDAYAAKNNMVQRVRFNPKTHNGPAGQIFKGFCQKNDAMTTRVGKTFENRNNAQTVGKPDVKPARKGVDGTMTITSIVSVNTKHGVFKFEDWDNLPVDNVWYGLKDNQCWPSDLAKEDPGWALLTNDEFYETQHPNLKQYRELYTKPPPLQTLKDALAKRGGTPPYPFSEIKKEAYKAKGFNLPARRLFYIPDEYVGVLPSLPFQLPIKRSLNNVTGDEEMGDNDLTQAGAGGFAIDDLKKMSIEDIHFTSDEDLAQMDDAQVDAWMARYMELLRRQSETSTNTSPPVSDAQPTPAGQADATAEVASVGSLGFDALPQATAA